MKVVLARKIDYWLGLPLCFLLSLVNLVLTVFSFAKNKAKTTGERILFIKLSELGAIILAYPLVACARQSSSAKDLFFLTFDSNKEIFSLIDKEIPQDNILTLRENSAFFFISDVFKVIRRIRKERIDLVFDLEFFSRFSAILSFLSSAKKRIGFYHYSREGLYRGNLLTHRVQYNPLLHISKSYLSLWPVAKEDKKRSPELSQVINPNELFLPKVSSKKETRETLEQNLKQSGIDSKGKIFLINPGEGVIPLREWPLENFVTLGRKILTQPDNYLIIIGAKRFSEKADVLLRSIDSRRCLNYSGKTSLLELKELFLISKALVISDCGLAHLAALTSIKKFIIFGPESPQIFGPLGENSQIIYSNWPCSPCLSAFNHRQSNCQDNKCLKAITPEQVYRLICNQLT